MTKDSDFYDSFIVRKQPYKLIVAELGNISQKEIIRFFDTRFNEIIEKIKVQDMILLRKEG